VSHSLRLAAVLLLFTTASVAADTAPHVHLRSNAELPVPLPLPYDEQANAAAQVEGAFKRAQQTGKRVLIDFGGNWCPDCRILAGVMRLPEVKSFIDSHYEIATVDVGRFDKNLDVVKRFGIQKLKGVPTVVVAEANGATLNVTNSADLANARAMSPQGITNWLARWAGSDK
jgi:thiol-disulfide isomerase/thioredoxin